MSRALRFAPLIVLLLFVAAVVWRLAVPVDQKVPSRLIGKPLPAFALVAGVPGKPGLKSTDLALGQPRIVNLFASWCVPCAGEAPQLQALKQAGVPIDAIAIRDRSVDIQAFLTRYGDPFDRIGSDPESRVQLALGSAGVPESFVVDGRGVIRYQHIGPIEPDDVPRLIQEMERAQ
ncbi:redoxin family protein [Sphingomonas jaspsi]|uniref:redoxin family protein n=1 Tax=Sphingomonas jaspsi TaxID=392409 RepID=UPI0004B344B1|nr:redoxin family protein [Sphingomonas jaspsi]